MKQTIFFLIATISTVLFAEPVRSMLGADGSSIVQTDGHDLPDGIVAVEFLESTGTQWIETGIFPSSDYEYEGDFSYVGSSPNGTQYFAGVLNSGGLSGNFLIRINSAHRILFDTPQYSYELGLVTENLQWMHLESGYSYFGGVNLYRDWTQWNINQTLVLFCRRAGNGKIYNLTNGIRIGNFMISRNRDMLLNLVPVRFLNENDEWEGAMYDLVSGELFLNQGSGNFIIGPDL